MRTALAQRRESVNFTIAFQGERYDVTVGYYETGKLGEIFINRVRNKTAARLGDHLDAACRDSAIVMSMLLQYGASLEELRHSVTRDESGEPMSIIGAIIDFLETGNGV